MRFSFQLHALQGIPRRLLKSAPGAKVLQRMHEALGIRMLHWAQQNVDQEGRLLASPQGPWPPAQKPQRHRLLHRTGRLRKGFQLQTALPGVRIVNSAPYAKFHHLGQGVPQRRLFPAPQQASELLQRVLLPIFREELKS